jgi:hypothetical protein
MTRMAVEASFGVFRRLFPVRPLDPSELPLSDEERRVYNRWEVWSVLPFFLFTAALGFAWYVALKGAAGFWHQATPETRFLIRPIPIAWGLPAFFLGIISSAIPLDWLYRLLLRDRYRRFERACHERMGFDDRPVLLLMTAIIVCGALLYFAFMVGSFARFTDSAVEIGRPQSFGSVSYQYTRVRAIEHRATLQAPNGNIVHRPHYVILFDDGNSWSTDAFVGPTPAEAEQIAQLVSRRSGRVIDERP